MLAVEELVWDGSIMYFLKVGYGLIYDLNCSVSYNAVLGRILFSTLLCTDSLKSK